MNSKYTEFKANVERKKNIMHGKYLKGKLNCLLMWIEDWGTSNDGISQDDLFERQQSWQKLCWRSNDAI